MPWIPLWFRHDITLCDLLVGLYSVSIGSVYFSLACGQTADRLTTSDLDQLKRLMRPVLIMSAGGAAPRQAASRLPRKWREMIYCWLEGDHMMHLLMNQSSVQKPHASGIYYVTRVGPSDVLKWFTVTLLSSLLVRKAEFGIQCVVVAQWSVSQAAMPEFTHF